MGRRAQLLDRRVELEIAARRRGGVTGNDHPLLRLQRTAGNRAVAAFVQRDKASGSVGKESRATFFFSEVALAEPMVNYKGKCNATFGNVRVERNWDWGLLYNDIAIVFQCGPQRFRFNATESHSGGMPWTMVSAKGGAGGYVRDPIQGALNTLYHHWNDEKRFGPASRVVIDALQQDVEKYCALEKEYRKGQASPKPWWLSGRL